MPRYYFDVLDGVSALDLEGTELPDIYTAQSLAIRTSGEILQGLGSRFWDGSEWTLQVADEQRRILFVVHVCAEERLAPPDGVFDLRPSPD